MRFAVSQHGFLSKLCHFQWRLGSSLSQNNGAQFPTQLLKTCSCTKPFPITKLLKLPRMIIAMGLLSYLFVSCLGLGFYSPSASCIAVVCFVYLPFFSFGSFMSIEPQSVSFRCFRILQKKKSLFSYRVFFWVAKLDLPLIVVGGSPGFYGVQCSSSTVVCLILTQKATGESVIFLLSEDTTLQRGGSVFIFRISTVDKLLTMRRNLCLLCI